VPTKKRRTKEGGGKNDGERGAHWEKSDALGRQESVRWQGASWTRAIRVKWRGPGSGMDSGDSWVVCCRLVWGDREKRRWGEGTPYSV